MLSKDKLIILPDYETLSRHVAAEIFLQVKTKLERGNKFVLGMATGSTPVGLYKELIELFKDASLDLSLFYTVNLDEYYPMTRTSQDSYYQYMMLHFWGPLTKINPTFNSYKNSIIPDGGTDAPETECARYEKAIEDLGGIDIQILGIGTNGHIGFNEPDSPEDSLTRVVHLAEETRNVNSAHFGGDISKVPKTAITMGIATIKKAKHLIILASGKSKAPIIRELMEMEKADVKVPASFLLSHSSIDIFVDEAASPL